MLSLSCDFAKKSVLERIRELLQTQAISFRELSHSETLTSEQSAAARGEDLSVGGKALLLKVDECFQLFVIPADRKLDSGAIKRHFRAKKLRFARADELMEQTGLVPGSVPPFGQPVLPFDLCVDERIRQNEVIAFNAGSLTTSFVLAVEDYIRAARPGWLAISASPDATKHVTPE